MDLSSPLRSVAPTLDSVVLEVLAGTEGALSVTQIARLGGRGTRQGLTLALDRLVDHGLVLALPSSRGHLYQLNRQHVLADAVRSAAQARVVILARLTDAVEGLYPRPTHVSVFGSFARREGGADSDIDLLIVMPPGQAFDDRLYAQLRNLGDQVLAWTGNRMEYLLLDTEGVADAVRNGNDIVESWLEDCITVLGESIEQLVQRSRNDSAGRRRR